MERIKKYVIKNWYILFTAILLCMQAGVFLIFREKSYIQVHDNLDLFASQLQMMKNTDTFFSHDVMLPMLGGISRNNFGSEFSLYNILFYILPNFWAYITGYALKIVIGIFSFCLLAKDVYGEKYGTYRPLILVIATAYGLIPVFPAYGIAFTSVPLIVWLLRRIYISPDKWLYLGVFLYPLLSYFSYFGIFLLAYVVLAIVILWIRDRCFPKGIALSLILLAAGYIVFEHRLFIEMLFSDIVTIRGTMVAADLTFTENIQSMWGVFFRTNFHEQDSHMYLVFPACVIGLLVSNIGYIRRKEYRKILTDSCNMVLGIIVFNCIIYGLYDWKAFRDFVEAMVPQLTGFQFNRFTFFNPFLWYALLFLTVKKMYDSRGKWMRILANGIVMTAAVVVMFVPQTYNDFYHTCYYNAYSILKQTQVKDLNYEEFYSKDLFEHIKEEVNYNGEWSAAYGFHPAVLQYNGIATLDGYLGMYSQEYKEAFRKVIAPALETADSNRSYFDDWGARAYLFSGSDENTYAPYRDLGLTDYSLQIDSDAYKAIGGRYIFSRIELSNREELGLELKGVYSQDSSPYTVYLYEIP